MSTGDDYTVEEEEKLTVNLVALATMVHDGAFSKALLSLAFADQLHRGLFNGVRSHAGQHRDKAVGSEYLTFGPNRSYHRDRVVSELDGVFKNSARLIAQCEDRPDAENYERAAFYTAVHLHARVIQVHPYEDGNGRTSRLLMNIVLVRLGFHPVPIEIPRDEYFAALGHFYQSNELDPLIDLMLVCSVARLPAGC